MIDRSYRGQLAQCAVEICLSECKGYVTISAYWHSVSGIVSSVAVIKVSETTEIDGQAPQARNEYKARHAPLPRFRDVSFSDCD